MTRLPALIIVCCFAASAYAEDDDDLAPLTPLKKTTPKKAPPPAKKAPPPVVKKAPTGVKKPVDDDLAPLAPVIVKGELLVRVASNVAGAVLMVDNKELGVLPLGPQSLSLGEHLVTVKRPGFAAFVKKVTLAPGKPVELEAKLAPVAAVLSVTSDLPDAQVLLNGHIIGTAPITDYEAPAGVVEVAVIKEGFHEDKQKLTLVAGHDYPIVVKFSAAPIATDRPIETRLVPTTVEQPISVTQAPTLAPVYQRWYFWVGVAAVVAAAAAGTAVAVTATQPPRKRTETEVCADKCDACLGLACVANSMSALSF